MKNHDRKAILLQFADTLLKRGSWCGETHVQKATYFLQELTGVPLGFDFILWKHGPYSFGLSDELEELRGYGLLKYRVNELPYGPTLVTTDRAQAFATAHPIKKYDRQINFIAKQLAGFGVVDLERLGTALLVTKEDPSRTAKERAEELHRLKPHVSITAALKAVRAVDTMLAAWPVS